jgi:RNA polymerase sigma factor (sigma-70 family)
VNGDPGDILLQALDPDPTIAETKLAYIRNLLKKFFEFNCLRDSEDFAQEVICRVINSLSQGKKITAKKPQSYFFGFAVNVLKEQRKGLCKRALVMTEDPDALQHPRDCQREFEIAEARILLDECGQILDQQERQLLLSYYLEGRDKLSRHLGISLPNLTLQVHRLKKRIREYVNKEDRTETPGR